MAASRHGDDGAAPPADALPSRRERRTRTSPTRRALSLAGRILGWTVTAVCVVLIVAFVLVPRVTGATPYTVLTGSMTPTMPPGTLVVVKPVEFEQLRVGDVVTYQLESGKAAVVTHRVIAIDVTDEGPRLKTQGDANAIADEDLVRAEQVRGVAWYWAPYIGYVTSSVTDSTKSWIARGVGVLLLGYAAFVVISALAKKRRLRS